MSPYAEQSTEGEGTEQPNSNNTLNGSGNLNISSNSVGNSISSSTNIEDIELYLNTYSNDIPELIVGACWWADSLSKLNQSIPKENIKRFRKELIIGLRDRIKGHWYPESPERGQGYRAVVCEESTDKLLMDAAKKSDIIGNFRSFFKQNTTMWIDPGNVTYRHGKHYEKTLYPFSNLNGQSNQQTNYANGNGLLGSSGSSSSLSNSGSSILQNSLLMNLIQQQQQINASSNNTTPTTNSINISGGTVNNLIGNNNSASSSTGVTPTKSLLNSNSINYNPIYFNPTNGLSGNTPPKSNNNISSPSTAPSGTTVIKNSPSLSSSAPAFSPNPKPTVYQNLINQQQPNNLPPPISPLKDFTQHQLNQKQQENSNNTHINNSSASIVYSRPQQTIKQNYI